jgi:hypothetical protein
MKALVASTAIVLLPASALMADTVEENLLEESEQAPVVIESEDGAEVAPETLNVRDVEYEGSGQTTLAPADVVSNREGAPVTPLNDQTIEGTDTDAASLSEGTTVVTPQTPATASIEDGQVVAGEGTGLEPEGEEPGMVLSGGDRPVEEMESDATLVANTDEVGADEEGLDVEAIEETSLGGLMAPEIEREGYSPVLHNDVVLSELEGVEVFGLRDEEVGEIGYTVNAASSPDGEPLVVLEIGGFLGLGEREIALPVGALSYLQGEDGVRAYIDASQEMLESMPEYDG